MNLLRVEPGIQEDAIWDMSQGDDARLTHTEVNRLLYPGAIYGVAGLGAIERAIVAFQTELVSFMLPAGNHPILHVEQLRQIRSGIDVCHAHGIPACTTLENEPMEALDHLTIPMCDYLRILDEFDAILLTHPVEFEAMPYLTKTPLYPWNDPSVICLRMQDQPYPETPREPLITVFRSQITQDDRRRGGARNLIVVRELLRRFPEYRLCIASGMLHDPLLDVLGIADRTDFTPRPFTTWNTLIDIYCRSKLVVHMDGERARGQVNYEAAACGTPVITTNVPQSSWILGIGVHHTLAFRDAIEFGTRLLTNPFLWEAESRRLFAVSKSIDLGASRRTVEAIVSKYRTEHSGAKGAA